MRDLIGKIDHFVTHYNRTCQPFIWTATADSILANLQRLRARINGTCHQMFKVLVLQTPASISRKIRFLEVSGRSV